MWDLKLQVGIGTLLMLFESGFFFLFTGEEANLHSFILKYIWEDEQTPLFSVIFFFGMYSVSLPYYKLGLRKTCYLVI